MWLFVRVEVVLLQLMVIGASRFVNLVSEQWLIGNATMGAAPKEPAWNASRAIDGNVSQNYLSNSCAITDVDKNRNTSIWWKAWLQRQFNVAYLEIYFRSDSCDPRRFSPGCTEYCSIKCKNQRCDAFNGSCIHGCSNPNALTIDCIVCPNGTFISNKECVDCPGHCKDGERCNKLTGMCNNGCADHWNRTFCEICSDHYYGTDCNTPCGHCKNNDVCDKGNGSCPNGCQSHWQGERCDGCSDHYYGTDCSTPCGRCKNNGVCDKGTGRCHDGCSIYWEGEGCDICQDGFYNATCSAKCGHCIREEICEKHDGTCISGCSQNFKPPLCQECVSYKYGQNCGFDCGHCKDGKDGVCTEGCNSGWIGVLCVTENRLTTTGVAIIASLSTMFAISLFVNFFMTRHIITNKTSRHRTDASVPENKTSPLTYVDLSTVDENHAYSTLGSTLSDTPYNVIGDSHHNI